jgi:hypothetical protein
MKKEIKTNDVNVKLVKVLLLASLAMFSIVGCGSRNTANAGGDYSSASTSTTTTTLTSSGSVAACNRYASSNGDLDYEIEAVTDSLGNRLSSLVRIKFLNVPSQYATQNWDIHIRKWTASSTGVVSPANTEAPEYADVRFDRLSQGIYSSASSWSYNLPCSTCPTLQWSNMQLIMNAQNQTISTANTFFSQYHLLVDLKDSPTNPTWKALQINFVDQNGLVQVTSNVLIPTFDADPSYYQKDHPPVLSNLHPFISKLNQGFTAAQLSTIANGYCF